MTQPELQLCDLKRNWISEAYSAIAPDALGEFTSDDLHRLLPVPAQPNWMGALLAKLRCAGRFVEVGRRKSERPEANGRKVTIWKVVP